MEKFCNKCGYLRNIDDFNKSRRLKDGHHYTCKICMKQWREINKASINIRLIAWRKSNREHLSKRRHNWKHFNREKFNLMEVRRLQAHYKLVNELKLKACVDCLDFFPSFCMDFDHKPTEIKKQNISRMLGHYSWQSITAEIEKCELICKNCHMIRTSKRARINDGPYRPRQETCAIVDEARSRPCSDCQKSYRIEVMQFDHVNGIKIDRLSRLKLTGTLQQVLDEIEKCDVVCANCHAIRTNTRDKLKLYTSGYRALARAILERANQASIGALQEV